MSAVNPSGFAVTAIVLVVVALGLTPKEEISYSDDYYLESSDYFLKSTVVFGRLQKIEKCHIYGVSDDEPETR